MNHTEMLDIVKDDYNDLLLEDKLNTKKVENLLSLFTTLTEDQYPDIISIVHHDDYHEICYCFEVDKEKVKDLINIQEVSAGME